MSTLNITTMDEITFRRTMGHFCTGIVVVTAMDGPAPVGFTCQSFISLSLAPPLVAFAPALTSRSYPAIRRARSFCINVLADSQQDLSAAFARRDDAKWQGIKWSPGPTGSPILDGVLAWVDCRLETEFETGDHYLVIGRVVGLEAREGLPLLYFKGAYAMGTPLP